jgi:hypothetical protein
MPTTKYSAFFALSLAGVLCLTSSGVAHIKAADIRFSSVEIVERPAPRSARLEQLVGQTPADQASAVIASKELKDRPNRLRLRVNFHSAVNLRAIANGDAIVFLHSYFCLHQNDFAVLSAPTVYSNGRPIQADTMSDHSTSGVAGGGFTYYFYLNAVRRESLNSKPPQVGFDLRVAPENVCFYVTGSGAAGGVYTSGTAIMPKEAIAAAIDQRRADASELDNAH